MVDVANLHFATISEVAKLLKNKEITSLDLTEAMLSRIEKLNPYYKAYVTVTGDVAREQARKADSEIAAGNYKGPLHGVPIGLKDLFQTKGIHTTVGSIIKKDWIPEDDAAVVEMLRDAGAVLLGKLTMTEFALSGYHQDLEAPINPWGEENWAGVSSSGSGVAAAAGLAFGTLGTDTGGSIRFPAAVNGAVGIKPTYGRVSVRGAFPLAKSLDHIGPITRSVADAAVMLQAVAGHDAGDDLSMNADVPDFTAGLGKGVKGMKIGIDRAYATGGIHPEIADAVLAAVAELEKQGAEIVELDIMGVFGTTSWWYPVTAVEALEAHEARGMYPAHADDYGPVFKAALEDGEKFRKLGIENSEKATAMAQAILDAAFEKCDVIACPSAPLPAMPLAEFPPQLVLPPIAVAPIVGFTAPYNFTGVPTISVPCGLTSENLPASLQLIGKHGDEATIIQAADAYERATDWQHPETN